MSDKMLTTFDNPYNPFTEFDRWWKHDIFGHNSCGLLADLALTSEIFSEEVNDEIINEAMEKIVKGNPTIFKIVTQDDFK